MLSSLPKLFDKNFILGFFLPALAAFVTAAWAFPDIEWLGPLRTVATAETFPANAAYFVIGAWLLALVLMTINFQLYQILEGLRAPVSWLSPLRSWQLRRFRALKKPHDELGDRWRHTNATGGLTTAEQDRFARLRRRLLTRFPSSEGEVLPTAFGNAIRAFEVYPREVYGADSIPIWPRLYSVMPKEYATLVDDARALVDCFVNIAYLAALLATIAVGRITAAVYQNWARSPRVNAPASAEAWTSAGLDVQRWLLVGVLGLVVAFIAYRWAIARVAHWGELVKSAFDCYLPALAKQMGYEVPPTEAERRSFWEEFNARALFQYPMRRDWPVAVGDRLISASLAHPKAGEADKALSSDEEAPSSQACCGEPAASGHRLSATIPQDAISRISASSADADERV